MVKFKRDFGLNLQEMSMIELSELSVQVMCEIERRNEELKEKMKGK